MNHTPGPWRVSASKRGGFDIVADNRGTHGGPFVVASRNDIDHRSEESLANCRLIAAAPEMLEALQAVLASGGEDWETGACVIRAAIAKAEGRS